MALKKDFKIEKVEFEGSLIAKDAYWKVTKINGNKEQMLVETTIFLNDAILGKKANFFIPSMNNENFIAQAYNYLKTLPEFADAEDC